jgi:O-antigen/teichoic acid export membrane protein
MNPPQLNIKHVKAWPARVDAQRHVEWCRAHDKTISKFKPDILALIGYKIVSGRKIWPHAGARRDVPGMPRHCKFSQLFPLGVHCDGVGEPPARGGTRRVFMAGPQFGRAGLWALLDNSSTYLFAFVFFVLSARMLGPQTFGIGVLALSVVQILTPLVESFFHDAIVQREDLDDTHLKAATLATLTVSVVLVVAGWAAAPALAALMKTPQLAVYLPWMLLSLLFSGLSAVPAAEARRSFNFKILAIRSTLGRSIGLVISIGLLLKGFGVWAMVAQQVTSAAFACVILLVGGARISLRGPFRLRSLTALMGFALPAVGAQLLVFGNSRIVTLIIGGALGPSAAGFWSVAFRFVEPLQTLLATTMGQLALSMASRRQGSRVAVGEFLANALRLSAVITAPIFLGLAVCARPILVMFIGRSWEPATPYMQIVCVVTSLIMLRQMVETSLSAIGQPRLNFLLQALGTGASVLGVAFGVGGGLLGATIGWSLRAAPAYLVSVPLVRRELKLTAIRQLGAVAPPLASALVMTLIVAAMQSQLQAWPAWRILAVSAAVGASSYVLLLALIDRSLASEVRALVRGEARASEQAS